MSSTWKKAKKIMKNSQESNLDGESDGLSEVPEMSEMSSTRKKAKKKIVKNSQESNLDNKSDGLYQDKIRKSFTYQSEIENLRMSSKAKEKLLELCRKVEKTLKPSPNQLEKIKNFDRQINSAGVMESELRMIGSLYGRDKDEKEKLFNISAYTCEEINIIEDNYYHFCKKFGFDPQGDVNIFLPSTFDKRGKQNPLTIEQLHVFCSYLSQNLPSRPPRSVYSKFGRVFYYYRKGYFSEEEDELLKSWYDLNPGNCVYSILGRILHRSRSLVRRRVLRLLGDESDYRRRTTNYVPPYVEDILNHKNDEYPDWTMNEEAWKKMADTNGQFNVKQIKKAYFQQVYPSVKASKKVSSLQFKRTLIKELSSLENPTWDNVDWIQLGEKCFKVGAVRVYSVIRMLTKKYVPREHWVDLAAALEIIKKEHSLLDKSYYQRKKKERLHDSDDPRADDPDACNAEDGSPKLKEKKVRRKSTRLKNMTRKSGLAADPDSNDIKISAPHSVEFDVSSELEKLEDLFECDSESMVVGSDGNTLAAHVDESIVEQQNCNKEHEGEETRNINSESDSKEQEVVTSISTDNPAAGDSNVAVSPQKKSRRHKDQNETEKLEVLGDCVNGNVDTKEIEKLHTDEVMLSPRHRKERVMLEITAESDVETETKDPDSGTRVRESLEAKEIRESHTVEHDVDAEVTVFTPRKKDRSKLDKNEVKTGSEDPNEDAAETDCDAKASAVTFSESSEGHFDSDTKKRKSTIKEFGSEVTPKKNMVEDSEKLVDVESEEGSKKQSSVGENENGDFITRRILRTRRN